MAPTRSTSVMVLSLLAATTLAAAPPLGGDARAPTTATKHIEIDNLERAFDEKLKISGRGDHTDENGLDIAVWMNRRTLNEAQVSMSFIIRTSSHEATAAICREATSQDCTCDHNYTTVMTGLSVTCTYDNVQALLIPHSAQIIKAEAALEVHASAIQTGATWGIDRIDQANLPLDNQYEHIANDGEGVKVFVLDTGIRCSHTEFYSRCARGWSAWQRGKVCPTGSATCAQDRNGHGTHCAGTIAGATYGVAKGATLVAVQVLDSNGGGDLAGVIGGMDWVAAQKAADPSTPMVASMSLGSRHSDMLNAAVHQLTATGVSVSVAAGNDNHNACLNSPASSASAVTAGSTTSRDARSSFSNYGSCVDIYAPGTGITSSWHTSDTATRILSGTSMACPHVSGVLALVYARQPRFTPVQATQALLNSAVSGILTNDAIPNVFLQSNIGALTDSPTLAPTETPDVDMGPIACGDTKTGDTTAFGDVLGGASNDNTYSFSVSTSGTFLFSSCGSNFDTYLRVYDAVGNEVASNDDSCGVQAEVAAALGTGDYTILIEGSGSAHFGAYTLAVSGWGCDGGTQGGITCAGPVTGDTTGSPNVGGNPAPDHRYTFEVTAASATASFSACGSSFDTFVRVLNVAGEELTSNDNACGLQSEVAVTLTQGEYIVQMEGYSTHAGAYTLSMAGSICNPDPPDIRTHSSTNTTTTTGGSGSASDCSSLPKLHDGSVVARPNLLE